MSTVKDHEFGRDFDRSDIDWDKTDQNFHLAYTANWNEEITRDIVDNNTRASLLEKGCIL